MRILVIGGANADISATTKKPFVPKDSNPGTIRLTAGGVARNIAHNLALLGDEVIFLTIFGGDVFGFFTADSCRKVGINVGLCDTAPVGTRSCFFCINDSNGEMVGGVSDMATADGITSDWIAQKLPKVGPVDIVVTDTNLAPEALAYLIDHVDAPLYVDTVSGAKASRISEAIGLSSKKKVHTVKCNLMEDQMLSNLKGVERRFISMGAEGVKIIAGRKNITLPALPANVVNATGSGDAFMAGIVHAGPDVPIEVAARIGLRCAKITAESPDTVENQLRQRYEELS